MFCLIINVITLIVWILVGVFMYITYKKTGVLDKVIYWLSYAVLILLIVCNVLRCIPVI